MGIILKLAVPVVIFLGIFLVVPKTHGATVTSLSDTITTSRPSASSPLSANAASGATQVSIYDNKSRFFPSDTARILRNQTGTYIGGNQTVATQSAALTTVYFQGSLSAAGEANSDVLLTPITSMHTVTFTVPNAVPVSGKVVIQFPTLTSGDANNEASPSATTFQLNNLDTNTIHVKVSDDGVDITASGTVTVSNPTAGTTPTVTFTLNPSTSIAAASVMRVFIGCNGAATTTCATPLPTVINPTKTAIAGTADSWTMSIKTQDASSNDLDTGKTKIATIDSVQVFANVDPTLTFLITGLAASTTISTNNSACTSNNDVTDTGSTSTIIDLGTLTSNVRISAQDLTVSTNAQNGYALTATASGQLRNPSSGTTIDSSTTPSTIVAGTEEFGIHPCGSDTALATTWYNGAVAGGVETGGTLSNIAWPTTAGGSIPTLATRSTTANAIRTTIEYAATISGVTEAGLYQSEITYVVTATF